MQDIFNDMDKVLAKFSDDMREMFKNCHREEVKKEEEFPRIGDVYWSVDRELDIDWAGWRNDCYDKSALSINNVFKTEEEAEQHRRFLLADAKLRKMADGGDWYIYYDKENKKFYIDNNSDTPWRIYSACYFSSEEKANQAIEEIGEDDLKLIFGIKELDK